MNWVVDNGVARIVPVQRFVFDTHKDFSKVTDAVLAAGEANRVVVDLRRVHYIDSAALGMLLMLREKASALGKGVSLAVADGMVRDVLSVANFHKLFVFE